MVTDLPGGIIGACLTPFLPDGRVDRAALERELSFLAGHCDAVSVLGAEVSEYRLLPEADRRALLRFSVEAVDGRVPVVAGVSSLRLAEVAELAELAAAAGAAFVQVLLPRRPWGPQAGAAELAGYVESVTRVSPLPVVVYHNPERGSDPPAAVIARIAGLDRVAGFKESSRDMTRIIGLIADIERGGLARYFTTMQPLLATLLQGGSGAMMPAPATLLGAAVVRAFRAGDVGAAAAAQAHFAHFPGRWRGYGLAPVMKCAMRHLGLDLGDSPAPFAPVSAQDAAAIGDFLDQAGVTGQLSGVPVPPAGSPR